MQETRFDESAALERAMTLFWRKGYENTSIKDLLTVMGIQNGSFYNSFGSKREVYLRSLELYAATILTRRIAAFQREPGFRSGLRAFFEQVSLDLRSEGLPGGCLVVDSIQSEILKDPAIEKTVVAKVRELKAFLAEEVKKAIDSGELPRRTAPKLISDLLVTFIQGAYKSLALGEPVESVNAQVVLLVDSLAVERS